MCKGSLTHHTQGGSQHKDSLANTNERSWSSAVCVEQGSMSRPCLWGCFKGVTALFCLCALGALLHFCLCVCKAIRYESTLATHKSALFVCLSCRSAFKVEPCCSLYITRRICKPVSLSIWLPSTIILACPLCRAWCDTWLLCPFSLHTHPSLRNVFDSRFPNKFVYHPLSFAPLY